MTNYRILTFEIDNTLKILETIKALKDSDLGNWRFQKDLCEKYCLDNGFNVSEVATIISPYYKYSIEKDESDKEVFGGIIHLGKNENNLVILEILNLITGERLPVHLYNIIQQEFLRQVVVKNTNIFKQYTGKVARKINHNSKTKNLIKKKKKLSLVVSARPSEFEIFDKRLNRPIHFISPSNTGDALMLDADEANIHGRKTKYFTPNNIAILLSVSETALKEAQSIMKDIRVLKQNESPLEFIKLMSFSVCNYIEKIQTSIVFTYTAIEAFVNLSIPDNYEFSEIKKESGVSYEKKYIGSSIERLMPLKSKIKLILPDIYGTRPIENEPFFKKFDHLEELRNKIIHQKSIEHTELYYDYFKDSILDVCDIANNLISFFYANSNGSFSTNPIWPTISGYEKTFPKSLYKSDDFEVVGDIHSDKV